MMRAYLNKRLFRLFGLIPLGIYVVVHLYNNNLSHQGPEVFDAHLAAWRAKPYIVPLTILLLYIPLFWHMVYGIYVAKDMKPNNLAYGYFANLKYLLQRLSGIGLALFIPAHIFKTKIEPAMHGAAADFAHMHEGFTEPLTLIVYALGILGISFHLANGLWSAAVSWGVTVNRKSQRLMDCVALLAFVLLLGLGANAVRGFMQ